jgi:Abnormal spindle-like microcephaly-assoc'd, ASPM-SPD-2-Hydin
MSSPQLARRSPVAVAVLALLFMAAWLVVTPGTADAGTTLFQIAPTKVAFGNVPVGSSVTKTVSVKNISGTSQVMSGSGGAAGVFGGVQNCQGNTLAPGSSCEMLYTFAPTATGVVTGSTSGSWNGQSYALNFSATGTPQFKIAPTALAFGQVAVGGTSPSKTVKITNLANQSVVMSGMGGAAGIFGGVQNCQGNTVAPGGSCEMFYAFSPTTTGPVKGSTSGSWNGQSYAMKFSGTGVAS